jgi:hypothetical protein
MPTERSLRDQIEAMEAELRAVLDWATVPEAVRSTLLQRIVTLKAKLGESEAAPEAHEPDGGD